MSTLTKNKMISPSFEGESKERKDEELKETTLFEDELEKRFGMPSNQAMFRYFIVLMMTTAATLIWLLTAVELLLKLTFDDSHENLAWYLAIQSTVSSFFSFIVHHKLWSCEHVYFGNLI